MHIIHQYSSSSSDEDEPNLLNNATPYNPSPDTHKSSRLPPPEVLEATDIQHPHRNRRKPQALSLPPVSPLHGKVHQYLVHVFLPLDHPELSAFACKLLGHARLRMVGKPLKAALTPLTDFHISISRPAVIRSEQVHLLVKQIRESISHYSEGLVTIIQKPVAFHSKNQRRLFIAAPLVTAACEDEDFTLSLIRIVSRVFKNNGLTPFFDDPRPHMSFAWTETIDISSLFAIVASDNDDRGNLTVPVKEVSCIIGKAKYTFPLSRA